MSASSLVDDRGWPRPCLPGKADLVEPAKAETLDKLGEGRQALGIAAASVREKVNLPSDAPTP